MISEIVPLEEKIQALEALILDNPELARLEGILAQFNIFEALGAVRAELRHSDFLGFLLDPRQSHGLGDSFVRLFLQKALGQAGVVQGVRPLDLDLWDLDELTVVREYRGIDLLLLDEPHRLAVVIENKVDTSEHDEQLQRYRYYLEQQYPDWRRLFFYLTPEGSLPSDEDYIPLNYQMVAEMVARLLNLHASTLGPDVRTLLEHYSQMVRRHLVNESEIAELCRSIYSKHRRALDLIYDHRPDLQAEIQQVLIDLVRSSELFVLDRSAKTYTDFAPVVWDTPVLRQGQGWTPSGRMLMFEWVNLPDRLALNLVLGPGPLEIRQRLFEIAQHTPPLRPAFKSLGKMYNSIYQKSFLTSKAYEEVELPALEQEIRKKWAHFVSHEWPQIEAAVAGQRWIWAEKAGKNTV